MFSNGWELSSYATFFNKKEGLYVLVGLKVFSTVVMKSSILWDATPCSYFNVERDVSEKHIACSSETSLYFQSATWCCIPGEIVTLHKITVLSVCVCACVSVRSCAPIQIPVSTDRPS